MAFGIASPMARPAVLAARARRDVFDQQSAPAPADAGSITKMPGAKVAPEPAPSVTPIKSLSTPPDAGVTGGAVDMPAPAAPPKFTGDWLAETQKLWNGMPGSTPDDFRSMVKTAQAQGIPISIARRMGGTMDSNDKIVGPDGRIFDLIGDESGKNLRQFNEDLPEPGEGMAPMLDGGPSAASQDGSLLARVLAQLGQQGDRAPQPTDAPTSAASQFMRQRDGLRSRARRDVFEGA